MSAVNSRKHTGWVISYNSPTRTGRVFIETGEIFDFFSTSFYGGRVSRRPIEGETVKVALNEDVPGNRWIVQGVWASFEELECSS